MRRIDVPNDLEEGLDLRCVQTVLQAGDAVLGPDRPVADLDRAKVLVRDELEVGDDAEGTMLRVHLLNDIASYS